MAGKIIMGIAYGLDVQNKEDQYVNIAQKALYAMNVTGNVGTYLVDYIPACGFFLPGYHSLY